MTKSFWREIEEKKELRQENYYTSNEIWYRLRYHRVFVVIKKRINVKKSGWCRRWKKREAILLWITKETRRRQADESKLKEEEELGKKFEKNTCDNRSSRRQSLLVSNEEEDVKSGVNIHNKGLVYVLSCLIFSFGSGCHSSYTIWWCQERDAPILLSNNQSTNTMFRWSNWPNVL